MKRKRALTLIEIMVVLLIIGIVSTVIGVNVKGTLKESKAFKSEKGSKQIYEILTLEMAKDPTVTQNLIEHPELFLKNSGLVQDPKKFLVDGFGEPFILSIKEEDGDLAVTSKKWIDHMKAKGLSNEQILDQYTWIDPRELQEDVYTH